MATLETVNGDLLLLKSALTTRYRPSALATVDGDRYYSSTLS